MKKDASSYLPHNAQLTLIHSPCMEPKKTRVVYWFSLFVITHIYRFSISTVLHYYCFHEVIMIFETRFFLFASKKVLGKLGTYASRHIPIHINSNLIYIFSETHILSLNSIYFLFYFL